MLDRAIPRVGAPPPVLPPNGRSMGHRPIRESGRSCVGRIRKEIDQPIHRSDIPRRTDLGKLPSYRTHKHLLFGKQEGHCAGCKVSFQFRNLTVDHVTPQSQGGTDHMDNLQLLCSACNSTKGDKDQVYDLPAFFGPPITGEQRQSAWLSRSRVLLGQREPASPASAHRHPSQHGAAL